MAKNTQELQFVGGYKVTYNGSQVYLVADLNAQNFQISNNLNKRTNVKFSTNSAIEYT